MPFEVISSARHDGYVHSSNGVAKSYTVRTAREAVESSKKYADPKPVSIGRLCATNM